LLERVITEYPMVSAFCYVRIPALVKVAKTENTVRTYTHRP
jgi:hypothetical protein